ncbi:MAG: GvpL/GvpF family gas vesicle protein, partial [Longimicrobiales bacterium]
MSEVVYLYGFVPHDASPPPPDLLGVAAAPVRLLDLGSVRAAVTNVPADAYASDRVESRLQDLAWVGEQGIAHERVVVWFADNSEILPARMFSLYSGDASLRAAVHDRLPEVASALNSLSGRREWNLKVAYDPDELARHGAEISQDLQRVDEEIAAAPPGRRYLLERRRADMLKKEVSIAARTLAGELLNSLRAHAEDVRVLPQPGGADTGTVVLNAALEVTRAAEAKLRGRMEESYERYSGLG